MSTAFLNSLNDDLASSFFAEHAEDCVYTPAGGQPVTIQVIYTPAEKGNLLQSTELENIRPQAMCMTTDVPNLRHNDSFRIRGATMYCSSMADDGTGVTTVELSEDKYEAK